MAQEATKKSGSGWGATGRPAPGFFCTGQGCGRPNPRRDRLQAPRRGPGRLRPGSAFASGVPINCWEMPELVSRNVGYNSFQSWFGDANDPSYWQNYNDSFGYNLYGY